MNARGRGGGEGAVGPVSGLRGERRRGGVLAGRFGRPIHGPTHRAWAIHGPLRQHPTPTPHRRFSDPALEAWAPSPPSGGVSRTDHGASNTARASHPPLQAKPQRQRSGLSSRERDGINHRLFSCANTNQTAGRDEGRVLPKQAMDGLRPVSRAMDGATEPGGKHPPLSPLPPEPTPSIA